LILSSGPINPDAGPKRAELWRAELVLVPRGALSYMLLLRARYATVISAHGICCART
jgi:hypothetical protein